MGDKPNRKAVRTRMIQYKGHVCNRCGEADPDVLVFHHVNPEDKHPQYTSIWKWEWDDICTELDKCELLCTNCHTKEHKRNPVKRTKVVHKAGILREKHRRELAAIKDELNAARQAIAHRDKEISALKLTQRQIRADHLEYKNKAETQIYELKIQFDQVESELKKSTAIIERHNEKVDAINTWALMNHEIID